ncbi:hypothetical protein ASF68_17150 [Plantibacter sp. Leaf314]|nr:hypothetical protein ASF68_17150 [Plantibacter sp. Leaf314]
MSDLLHGPVIGDDPARRARLLQLGGRASTPLEVCSSSAVPISRRARRCAAVLSVAVKSTPNERTFVPRAATSVGICSTLTVFVYRRRK